jgi:glutamyl-tRNA synthetase
MLAWLSARAQAGRILLRIEDLDGPRVKVGAEKECLRDLEWLGLDWDGETMRQSERAGIYEEALRRLVDSGRAYACTCTRREVDLAASAPHAGEEGPVYPGTCRGRYGDAAQAQRESGRTPAYRFAVEPGELCFEDGFLGTTGFEVSRDLGDFVIFKRDGEAAYQLAVVVDDAAMGVTEVLRGADLLPSAARQIQLATALGLPSPRFIHVPLVVGEDGRRLAKRHGDTSLQAFRESGVSAEVMLGWLAWSAGLQDSAAPTDLQRLKERFTLPAIPKTDVIWHGDLKAPMTWRAAGLRSHKPNHKDDRSRS